MEDDWLIISRPCVHADDLTFASPSPPLSSAGSLLPPLPPPASSDAAPLASSVVIASTAMSQPRNVGPAAAANTFSSTNFSSTKATSSTAGRTATAAPEPSVSLIVSATPEQHLVYTNHVYVNDAQVGLHTKRDATQPDAYVCINNQFVYVARAHKGVTAGNIGLSSIQRDTLKVSSAQPADVSTWLLPADGSRDLLSLRLDLELIGTKRSSILGAELAPALAKLFNLQVFTKGQSFCTDFQGTALKFTVVGATAGVPVSEQERNMRRAQARDRGADDDEEEVALTQDVNQGVVRAATRFDIAALPSKFLTFKPLEVKKNVLNSNFKFADMGIGGLDAEFSMIFRRSFASRLFPPEVTKKLGIRHVKGMLLYGPPGTGKTLIARQIGKILATKEPKVVNGPEILNKFVGASEENIRNLFKEAEEDTIANGDNADLHIIIFDEIDAICKARGRGGDSTGVHDTVVNQLLSKIDGVNALNNILVIGMTNRKDMIDPALLRPGRLEVHIEIGLPDEKGRVQIFNIHLKTMRESNMLGEDVAAEWLAAETKNFSGAEIEGLVKSASSFALYESIDIKKTGAKPIDTTGKNIVVRAEHFRRSLDEVKAAFGVDEDELKMYLRSELLPYGSDFEKIMTTCQTLLMQVKNSKATPLLSVLLEGPNGSGKTSIAAKLAVDSGFPYVKVISPEQFVGDSDQRKCAAITKIFEDAYKSPLSLIILDSIERLLEYVAVGPRFSQAVLQTLLVLVNRIPPHSNRKLLIIGTSSRAALLESLEITQAFNVTLAVPALTRPAQVQHVLAAINFPASPAVISEISSQCYLPIPVKQLLMVAEMSRQGQESSVTPERFAECLQACGFDADLPSSSSRASSKNDLAYYTSAPKKGRHADDDY